MNPRNHRSTNGPVSSGSTHGWAASLVQRAARRAPPELAEQHSSWSRLRVAMGCYWARQVICHDPAIFGATMQRAASGHGAVAAFAPPELAFVSRRTLMLLAIIALHIVVIYEFGNGLISSIIELDPPVMHGTLIDETHRTEEQPTLPQVDPANWAQEYRNLDKVLPVPLEEIKITDGELPPTRTTDGESVVPRHIAARVIGGPGAGFPSTAQFYPSVSRQLGEQGVAAVQVCIDAHGRLTDEPALRDSSGSARLDAGALALARAGSGHYRSTTEDGQPVDSCYAFRVRFDLK